MGRSSILNEKSTKLLKLVRRPRSQNFDKLNFTLMKVDRKYFAFCQICKTHLHNTAEKRLQSHRNVCKIDSPSCSEFGNSSSSSTQRKGMSRFKFEKSQVPQTDAVSNETQQNPTVVLSRLVNAIDAVASATNNECINGDNEDVISFEETNIGDNNLHKKTKATAQKLKVHKRRCTDVLENDVINDDINENKDNDYVHKIDIADNDDLLLLNETTTNSDNFQSVPSKNQHFSSATTKILDENPTKLFAKYLESKLNQFGPKIKATLIYKINNLIFEAEMLKYNKNYADGSAENINSA